MATEAPGNPLRDWTITTQEDGTLRVTRSAARRNASFAKGLLRCLGRVLVFGWLRWLSLQLLAELWWLQRLALPVLGLLLCLEIFGIVVGICRWIDIRREWVLGQDFLEDHQRMLGRWWTTAFQGCTIQLIQHRLIYGTLVWYLYLDGEAARKRAVPDKQSRWLGDPHPAGWLLAFSALRDGPDQLRALGELISSHTGWAFSFHSPTSADNPSVEEEVGAEEGESADTIPRSGADAETDSGRTNGDASSDH